MYSTEKHNNPTSTMNSTPSLYSAIMSGKSMEFGIEKELHVAIISVTFEPYAYWSPTCMPLGVCY